MHRRAGAVVLLSLAVLLAGCGFLGGSNADGVPDDQQGVTPTDVPSSPTPTAGPTATSTPTPTPSPTRTPSPTPTPANPWGTDTLTVAIDESAADGSFEPVVQNAVDAWANRERPYAVGLEFVPNATDPDVVVEFTPTIDSCGDDSATESFHWCGPVIERGETPDDPEVVQVASRYDHGAVTTFTDVGLGQALGVEDPEDRPGIDPPDDPALRDPWPGDEPVTVGLNVTVDDDRDYAALIRDTVSYWQTAQTSYADYTVDLQFAPNATEPDVEVRIVDAIEQCGISSDEATVGCAPVLDDQSVVEDRVLVRIESGYDDESTLEVMKHEFGHVYGLEHGEEPMPLMAEGTSLTLTEQPDVNERPYNWGTETVTVYLNRSSFPHDRTTVDAQVDHAVDYYSGGADGHVPDDLELTRTSNESAADVVIRHADLPCGSGDGSCGNPFGYDTDDDGNIETYASQTITLHGVDSDRVGWHVGYWLGYSQTNATARHQLPPPFDGVDDDPTDWYR